jgi:hypothetical protein
MRKLSYKYAKNEPKRVNFEDDNKVENSVKAVETPSRRGIEVPKVQIIETNDDILKELTDSDSNEKSSVSSTNIDNETKGESRQVQNTLRVKD